MTKKTKLPTLKDVAHEAKVSLVTAGRVLRGGGEYVAAETRERVLAAAKQIHYVPNRMASVLKGGSHRSIGLVVGDMRDPYFGEIAQAVSLTAQERSLVAIVANMHRDPLLEIGICEELWEHRVNGIILAGGGFDQMTYNDRLRELVERLQGMNVIAVSLTKRNLPVPCFAPDNGRAGEMAAEHVLAHGHSDVAVVVGPANSEVTRIRLKAIRKVFRGAGIAPKVIHTDFGEAAGEDVARDLLRLAPTVTAIIASGDRIGLGLTHLLMARGWRVPEDISIISIGSTYLGRRSHPRLTAIDTALAECGTAAVNYIADALDGEAPAKPRLGTVTLIPGESMQEAPADPRRRGRTFDLPGASSGPPPGSALGA